MADLKGIIVTFIMMLIGIALTPTIQEEITGVTGAGTNASLGQYNLTGAANSLMGLVPMFWVLFVLGAGIILIYVQFKKMS